MSKGSAPEFKRLYDVKATWWTGRPIPRRHLSWRASGLYNLVISDLKMPGLSGLDLMTQVRAHNADTLFILMTAYGTVENAVEAMKQGAYDYLPKPLDMKRLRALVQKSLEFQAVVGREQRIAPAIAHPFGAELAGWRKRSHAGCGSVDRRGREQRRDRANRGEKAGLAKRSWPVPFTCKARGETVLSFRSTALR
jgi:DNA-binding response OmpR family regulator